MKQPRTANSTRLERSGDLCHQDGCYRKPVKPYPYCQVHLDLKVATGEYKICRFCGQPWEPKTTQARMRRGHCYLPRCIAKRRQEIYQSRRAWQKEWYQRTKAKRKGLEPKSVEAHRAKCGHISPNYFNCENCLASKANFAEGFEYAATDRSDWA